MNPEIPHQAKSFLKDMDLKKFNKIEWDEKDWEIFYHCIGFALWRINNRTRTKSKEIDFQI